MSIQRISQGLVVNNGSDNGLVDIIEPIPANNLGSSRSPGVIFISPLALGGPLIEQNWKILGISCSANLSLALGDIPQLGGKFGKIWFGVDTLSKLNPTAINLNIPPPFINPNIDSTLTANLWDPSIGDLPPVAATIPSSSPNFLYLSSTVLPPQPITLQAGTQPNFVIAMEPCLFCWNNTTVTQRSINVILDTIQITTTYDDGT